MHTVEGMGGSWAAGLWATTAVGGPAELAMSERLRAQLLQTDAAIGNIENAMAYTQTAGGWLQSIQDMLGRMGELAVSANSGLLSPLERGILQTEFAQMQQGIQSITTGPDALARYNGIPLFQGGSLTVQTGPDSGQAMNLAPIDLTSANAASIGELDGGPVSWGNVISGAPAGFGIGTQAAAALAGAGVSLGVGHLGLVRATLGAQENRLVHAFEGLRNYQLSLVLAGSGARDTDRVLGLLSLLRYRRLGPI